MPMSALVGQIIARLVGEGYGDEDFATLIKMQAGAAGVDLRPALAPAGATPPRAGAAKT